MATPRISWLDRWLEPRWRALLTWVGLAALTGVLFEHGEIRDRTQSTVQFLANHIGSSGVVVSPTFQEVALYSNLLFLVSWFPPIILRVGMSRTLIWIGLSMFVGWASLLGNGLLLPSRALDAIVCGQYGGLPGLASSRRRSRPWLSLAAGIIATGGAYVALSDYGLFWVILPAAHLAYGAVMLYGTDPLPRRPAGRQLGEDQR